MLLSAMSSPRLPCKHGVQRTGTACAEHGALYATVPNMLDSNADILDGSERFVLASVNPRSGIGPVLFRDDDLSPRASGQGSFQVRWRPSGHDVELGLYAIRYHEKLPQLYLIPSAAVPGVGLVVFDPANFASSIGKFGRYQLVYPENIKAFGAWPGSFRADWAGLLRAR